MLFAQGMLVLNWEVLPQRQNLAYVIGGLTGVCLLRVMYLQLFRRSLVDRDNRKPRRGDASFWPDQVLRDAGQVAIQRQGTVL